MTAAARSMVEEAEAIARASSADGLRVTFSMTASMGRLMV